MQERRRSDGGGGREAWRRATPSMLARVGLLALMVTVTCVVSCAQAPSSPGPAAQAPGWPMYAFSLGRSGYNGAETSITPTSASTLRLKWTVSSRGARISAQPVVANGLIYWGSWDGIEHATDPDGNLVWRTNLGVSPAPPGCAGDAQSMLGSAAVAPVTIEGKSLTGLFVGGGRDVFYALDAATGTILWRRQVATPPADIWSSPIVYNGSVYTSTAGWGDCPGAQGQVFQLNAATGAIQHTFDVVPAGCIGGGVWGSITIDARTNTLYMATGNDEPCPQGEPYAIALVQLRASDLSFMSAWQLPRAEHGEDGDFGSTPTLFTATLNGTLHSLLGIANKNGTYYAFDEARIGNGPVWQTPVAQGGIAPEIGDGSVSPSAWDGSTVYVAGGHTTIRGQRCPGSVRALDPATGAVIWQNCVQVGIVLGAVAAAPGVIAVGAGNALVLLSAGDGHPLALAFDQTPGLNAYFGGPAIAGGAIYIGNANGNLHAYGTG